MSYLKTMLAVFFVLIGSNVFTQTKRLDVPYVPTDQVVVDAMLDLAGIKAGDVHFDLGCGDGRIVISAAKRGAAEATGIDLDPERIKEANANAVKAGVADKVTFIEGDLFDFDFSKADVLTLYLLSSVNLKLRPKILEELKPGTRVVSHAFGMGDWKPEKEVNVGGTTIYLWTVPERGKK
ncbi:class I SAM-dependent methyltransferase [Sphingobacterium olei]|uniref:Class I SAM-dependent methyltransferase n=1 Tax=Sphingobacterium olei TaxID=2571155 RepID=A0A4U0NAC5_9SPHI|nr:class I SAM-dependent methyltransferase [Sphingobacterium olei]TJZ50855.1 class I SAM-dependent methyltransferase [Sphingobacterium olei]